MRIPGFRAAAALVFSLAAVGCGRAQTVALPAPAEALDRALAPARLAASLRRGGGGHLHAVASFRADVVGKAKADDGSKPASPAAITTTTDLWLDRRGNFRLSESNDQDGGREIVRKDAEVAVALRYGKLLRRPAQDAESNRFLAEALGGPWSVWEVVRRQVEVEGTAQAGFRFKLRERLANLPAGFPAAEGLRNWRDSVEILSLEGQVGWDAAGKLPLAFVCKTSFQAIRDGQPIAGELAVTATLDRVGQVADVVMPEADPLQPRQRTVLEERALLGGLNAAAAAKKSSP